MNLSTTPKYRIKDVSVQTGIPAVTIRAWERRYDVLIPARAGNSYRMYSDHDIAVLRWLKTRVDSAVSISNAVAELRRAGDDALLAEPAPAAPARRTPPAMPPARYARELYLVLTRHDEAGASELVQEAFAHFDLMTVLLEIFIPCLVEIGEAWSRGYIRITTEHFASAFLRGKLLTLLQSYTTNRAAPSIMVGGAPTEEHEIGALMMSVLLRGAGYRVEFLGADLPLDDLVDHARFEKPNLIILTATTRPAAVEMTRMQEKLSRLRPAPLFGYGGFAFIQDPTLRQTIPGVFLGETLAAAVEKVDELLKKNK